MPSCLETLGMAWLISCSSQDSLFLLLLYCIRALNYIREPTDLGGEGGKGSIRQKILFSPLSGIISLVWFLLYLHKQLHQYNTERNERREAEVAYAGRTVRNLFGTAAWEKSFYPSPVPSLPNTKYPWQICPREKSLSLPISKLTDTCKHNSSLNTTCQHCRKWQWKSNKESWSGHPNAGVLLQNTTQLAATYHTMDTYIHWLLKLKLNLQMLFQHTREIFFFKFFLKMPIGQLHYSMWTREVQFYMKNWAD